MFDWNGNGKHDSSDSFIEYNIYKDITGGSHRKRRRRGPSQANTILLILFIIVLILMVRSCGEDSYGADDPGTVTTGVQADGGAGGE